MSGLFAEYFLSHTLIINMIILRLQLSPFLSFFFFFVSLCLYFSFVRACGRACLCILFSMNVSHVTILILLSPAPSFPYLFFPFLFHSCILMFSFAFPFVNMAVLMLLLNLDRCFNYLVVYSEISTFGEIIY